MTISKRTIFEAIKANATNMTVDTADGIQTISAADVKAFAENEINLIDKKNAKARERSAAKRAAGDELTEVVASVLTSEYQTIGDVAAQISGDDVTVGKVSNRLSKLVASGRATKEQISVTGEDGKASKKMAYAIVG